MKMKPSYTFSTTLFLMSLFSIPVAYSEELDLEHLDEFYESAASYADDTLEFGNRTGTFYWLDTNETNGRKLSFEELIRAGARYSLDPREPEDIVKSANYFLAAEKRGREMEEEKTGKKNDGIVRPGLHGPNLVLAAQVVSAAADEYANPENDFYDLNESYLLQRSAGLLGLQTAWISAAYVYRFMSKENFRTDIGPADMARQEASLLRNATGCLPSNVNREFLPYTEDICAVARQELQATMQRGGKAYGAVDESDSTWLVMGLLGLAALAILNGADPEATDSDSKFMDITERTRELIYFENKMELLRRALN